jgi:hypothetical protein
MVRKILDTRGSISKLEASHLNIGNINDVMGMFIETVTRVDPVGRKYTRWVRRYA